MGNKVIVSAAALACLATSGCVGLSARTGVAAVMVQTEAGNATSAAGSSKEGKACSQNILGIVALGDSSVASAKTTGGITTVSSVDYKYLNVLGFYGRVCAIVKGE